MTFYSRNKAIIILAMAVASVSVFAYGEDNPAEHRDDVFWKDQSDSHNNAFAVAGKPEIVTSTFSKGDLPVVRFHGKDYFTIADGSKLRLDQFSIYAVIKVKGSEEKTSPATMQTFYSSVNPQDLGNGMILQISPDRKVYFFTSGAQGSPDGNGNPDNRALYDPMFSTVGVSEGWHIITATYDEKNKNIYADGVNIGSSVAKGINYLNNTVASIGAMREFDAWFKSEIAEIAVYDTVDAKQRASVEHYLGDKYGIIVPKQSDSKDIGKPVLLLKADSGFTVGGTNGVPAGFDSASSLQFIKEKEEKDAAKAKPAAPRTVTIKEYLSYAPVFATSAKTFDPIDLAHESWKGWVSQRGVPWGVAADFQPSLRLPFDCRALPWPNIKEHGVDGPDNNMRAIGGLALLHSMLGDEVKNDPAEHGIVSYLQWCTDPVSGIPFSPDSGSRGCAVGHGEHTKNLLLMYKYTGDRDWLEWANRALKTLRYYAVEGEEPGIGKVATYYQGMFTPGQPRVTTGDATMGGWLHLALGWNLWAFSEDYAITGDDSSLDFAEELGNRLCHGADPDGNDGAFRPDGSFGGKSQSAVASWHMHGHTHCLPGLTELGAQLIRAGRRDSGLRFIQQASHTFDWLYDPTKNPDAGSMTGWLGEWLMVATGWPRKSDCEGCTVGDVVETACGLGAASRIDPSLSSYVNYYDRAEQIFTGQLYEQRFRPTPRYLTVMRECIEKHVAKELTNSTIDVMTKEVEKRYQQAVKTGERMVGQQMGLSGFPDWVNQLPSDLDASLPGLHMQGCCADATIRGSHAIWEETVTGDEGETRVNMAFNRKSPLVDVVSCLPHRGELDVTVKGAKKVMVRIPEWASKDGVKVYRGRKSVSVKWDGSYVVFDKAKKGEQLTVTYPLRVAEVKETVGSLDGTEYTERWRGNTIVDISPGGKWIPMFQRPELESEMVP